MKLLRVTNSNIKRYYHLKIRPTKEIEMVAERELKNCHDPYAMIIKMALLSNMPCEFHDKFTREDKGNFPEQRVKDIADKVVGRVPANLYKLFLFVLTK